ncbi:MAG: hypothetical protein HRU34_07720 [Richelia sp.]|nr:hypothetical protein [Richelia sp.]
MFGQQPQQQQKVKQLATEGVESSQPLRWVETLYAEAQGYASQVPWAKLTPHPYLEYWLRQKQTHGQKKSALVIGCGWVHDAESLS